MKRKHWLGATGAALLAAAAFGAPQAQAATTYTIIGGSPLLPAGQLAYEMAECPASLSPVNVGLETVIIDVSARRGQDLNMSWSAAAVAPSVGGLAPQFFSGGALNCNRIHVQGLRATTTQGAWTLRVPADATFLAVTGILTANVTLTVN